MGKIEAARDQADKEGVGLYKEIYVQGGAEVE